MSITASNLSCSRGARTILSGVSFTLTSGDCLILKGENGAGKTTLLRTLASLNPPSAGTLACDPDDILYSGHLDAVKSQLSVLENLTFWAGVYKSDALPQTMIDFDLTDLAQRPAATLSAGQKRRLGLARLALSSRNIWLLDEPTSSLDAHNSAFFETLLQNHIKQGGIAVVSTHRTLKLPSAKTLDLGDFQADPATQTDPFLQDFT